MSHDRSRRSEQVLARIRASAGPAPGVERRVLAGVEQRIALEAGALEAGQSGAAGATAVAGRLSRAASAGKSGRASHAAHVAARLGRWGLFGLVAGAIGYQLGVSQERAANEAAPQPVAALGPVTPQTRQPLAAASPPRLDGSPAPAPRDEPRPSMLSESQAPAAPAAASGAAPSPSPVLTSPRSTRSTRSTRAMPSRAVPSREPTGPGGDEPSRASAPDGWRPLSMAELLARLQLAQKALHDGDPHAALAELDALDRVEREGKLGDERWVLRALALCDIGRVGEARRALAKLEGRGSDSIYRGRLEQGCAAALVP